MATPQIHPNSKTCVTCKLFGFDPVAPRLNRECLSKSKIVTRNGRCTNWKDQRSLKQKLLRQEPRVKAFTA